MNELMEKSTCSVTMNGTTSTSEDFVAILSKDNGDASIYYNTDALTLGMAFKLIAKEFVRCLNDCAEEERKEITEILGEAFVADTEEVTANA